MSELREVGEAIRERLMADGTWLYHANRYLRRRHYETLKQFMLYDVLADYSVPNSEPPVSAYIQWGEREISFPFRTDEDKRQRRSPRIILESNPATRDDRLAAQRFAMEPIRKKIVCPNCGKPAEWGLMACPCLWN